jgi:hypothetical protein
MLCRCGNAKILALGLCSTCYTLKRQDDEYFGGLREQVLERDGYRCRGCGAQGRTKRSITVHLKAGVDDFTLPWLPRKSRADEDGAFRDEPTAAHAMAGASPERAGTGDARFRIEAEPR